MLRVRYMTYIWTIIGLVDGRCSPSRPTNPCWRSNTKLALKDANKGATKANCLANANKDVSFLSEVKDFVVGAFMCCACCATGQCACFLCSRSMSR